MAGVAVYALAGGKGRTHAVGDAADQHIAAGILIVDVDLRIILAGDIFYGDGTVARRYLELVAVHGKRLVEGCKQCDRRCQLRGIFGQLLPFELKRLNGLAHGERAEVEVIALAAARERYVRVLNVAFAVVFHADAEHVRDRVVRAVLDVEAGIASDADDLEAAADVEVFHLLRCGGGGFGIGAVFRAGGAAERQRKRQKQRQNARGAFRFVFHSLLLKNALPKRAGHKLRFYVES